MKEEGLVEGVKEGLVEEAEDADGAEDADEDAEGVEDAEDAD